MNTAIVITSAVFKCQADEDIFYQRVSTISGIQKVITEDNKLYISVLSEYKNQALKDINELCDIWHATFTLVT